MVFHSISGDKTINSKTPLNIMLLFYYSLLSAKTTLLSTVFLFSLLKRSFFQTPTFFTRASLDSIKILPQLILTYFFLGTSEVLG